MHSRFLLETGCTVALCDGAPIVRTQFTVGALALAATLTSAPALALTSPNSE